MKKITLKFFVSVICITSFGSLQAQEIKDSVLVVKEKPKPKTAPLYEFVDPQQISIMGEIVELLGVERHFTTETSEVIHLTQWIVTSGWKANYEGV